MSALKLSLCVITGNIGAAIICRFLNSFSPFVDEIVLVRAIGNAEPDDTFHAAARWGIDHRRGIIFADYLNLRPGSEDWPHVDDFAAARNLAWSLATGDWLMWADTDDIISPEAGKALRAMIDEHGDRFDMLVTPYVIPDTGIQDNPRERVVRRGIARWEQAVHECLAPIDPEAKWRTASCAEARIIHDPGARPPSRNGRNLRILESLPESELTTSLRYHLYAEQFAAGNIGKGALAAEAFLSLPEGGPTERFECMLSMSMVMPEPRDKAQWLTLAWQECPHRREPLVLLANLAQNAGDIPRARALLTSAGALPLPERAPWNLRRKVYGWQFVQELARLDRAEGRFEHADTIELNHFIRNGGKISLLHATRGRPQEALDARNLWIERAENPDGIEHIFGCDPDDEQGPALGGFRHIVQNPGGGPCGAWNMAASIAHGEVLVQVSDDMVPPQGWDRLILEKLGDLSEPKVLRVSDGHRQDGLIVLAIVTRAWVKRQGYLFHPGFFSMFSDNWLTESAERAGVIIEAPEIVFEHRHPAFTGEAMHPTTAQSNRLLHYATGKAVLDQLRAGRPVFTWQNIPGLSEDDSPALVHERVISTLESPLSVEVGVAKGRSLACIATLAAFKGGGAVGIDTFEGTPDESVTYPEDMEAQCRANISRTGTRCTAFFKGESVKEAAIWPSESVDYVFLDAAHDFDSVAADIAAWWPKVKPGGWLAGHDYIYAEGVKRAVDETFPAAEKLGECWLVQKPL